MHYKIDAMDDFSGAALQRRSYKKVFWKYAANLQENTYAEVWFQGKTHAEVWFQ